MSAISMISDQEAKEIILSACKVRAHTEDDLKVLVKWAESARMDNALVDGVLDGRLLVFLDEGEITFKTKEESK